MSWLDPCPGELAADKAGEECPTCDRCGAEIVDVDDVRVLPVVLGPYLILCPVCWAVEIGDS